jgi:chaperone BCS1
MSDNTLTTLMGHVPSRLDDIYSILKRPFLTKLVYRCILLLEDLDAAFTRSVSRDSTSTGAPTAATKETAAAAEATDGSTLSLSGLLNSLDGVAAAEGR